MIQGLLGSGFFVSKNGYIVTCAHIVLKDGGKNPDDAKAFAVFADVSNANQIPENDVQIVCTVIGVDRAADLAVIKTVPAGQTAFGYDLTNQRFLWWGDSTNTKKGSDCYLIGDPFAGDAQSISCGCVRDNKYVIPTLAATEQMLVDTPGYKGNSGSPILDKRGKIIGVFCSVAVDPSTGIAVDNLGGGASQFIAEFVTRRIIATQQDYRQKGYLGANLLLINSNSLLSFLRLTNPAFAPTDIGRPKGLLIQSLDNIGTTPGRRLVNAIPDPLQPNDIMLSARIGTKQIDLGIFDNQFHISRLTWLHPPGTIIHVTFIRPSDGITRTSQVILDAYPIAKDVVSSTAAGTPAAMPTTPISGIKAQDVLGTLVQ